MPRITKCRRPSFFKILIGDFTKQLRIPPAFVKNFNGNPVAKSTLKSPSGKIWVVNVEENVNGLFFIGNGWQQFLKHNSIEYGDFLVFKYKGRSDFSVRIYDKSACEKKMKDQSGAIVLIKQEQESETETESEKKVTKSNKGGCVKSEKKPTCVINGKDSKSSSLSSFKSNYPCSISTWTKSSLTHMTISKKVAREKKLESKRKAVLKNRDGKSWNVQIRVRDYDGRVELKEGWPAFRKSNKIEENDCLVFEFIEATVIQVHIFRAKDGVVPIIGKCKKFIAAN